MSQQKNIQTLLHHSGFESFNALQNEVIEQSNNTNNLLILSQTGSGKTLAFLIPLIVRLKSNTSHIQALILAPSRELAQQIETVFKSLKTKHKVLTCYGGHSMRVEENSLTESPAVLIGTPGRICDHITRENISLSHVSQFVIDEYDKCLELGFEDQMNFICRHLETLERTSLVSATELTAYPTYLSFDNPTVVNYLTRSEQPEITFYNVPVSATTKYDSIFRLLCSFNGEQTIVFCNFREATEQITDFLREKGFESIHYHGGMEQDERERALLKFRNGSHHTLICTDLGARGLDIPEIQHVVHFQYPHTKEAFVHRNGRTARMKANGSAYLLINSDESLPEYITIPESTYTFPAVIPTPVLSEWITLYISGGKKDKLNKIDLVGFLIQKGGLHKEEIGLITVMDFTSFVAVKRDNVRKLLANISEQKMKGKKWKIGVAR
jgi:ATP-dependent RNA helicase DeaD